MSERPNLLIIFRDITERRKMEKNLRQYSEHLEDLVKARTSDLAASERKYRLLLDNMADAVFTINLNGNLTFATPQTEKMTGYTIQQLLSMNIRELIAPESWSAIAKRFEARERGESGVFPMQFDLVRADGTRLPLEIHTSLLTEGNKPIGVQGVAHDVAERKRMEDALRESEKRFRGMTDMLPETVFELDMNGKLTFLNETGFKMIGYDEDDLKKGLNAFQVISPENHSALGENIRRIMSGGPSPGYEYVVIRKDGSRFPGIAYASPIIKEGKSVGLRGVLVDITERKKMEAELAKSQRLAAIGETAAMVGHDLRNPLQATTSTLYLARKLLGSGSAEDRDEALGLLEELDSQVYYMDKVVSDLQHYANPVSAALAETNLPNLIMEAISNVKIPRTVQVSMQATEDLSRVMANAVLLRRVLVNLVMNAVQAMPEGGKLTIAANSTQDSVAITVQDTGVGIPPENLERIFSPFYSTKAQGQGLGLAVCKRLTEAQGGTIHATSQVGKGSTFTITIPHSKARAGD